MQEEADRVGRFIRAFEKLYGRKPQVEDAEGKFRIRVAADMHMSAGGARYYIRLAAEPSVVTSKPAIGGQAKTGQWRWPRT